MSEQKDRGEDSGSELWTSNWEQQCLDELDSEPNLEERLPQKRQYDTEKMWYSFQNCAGAVTQLYKDRQSGQSGVALWIAFQNAASSVTSVYKDSLDLHRQSTDLGVQSGYQRRTRDIVAWAKKRRRHIRREDLLAFLCGKAPPPPRMRSNQLRGSSAERSSPRLTHSPPHCESSRPGEAVDELQPFREALALQGCLNRKFRIGERSPGLNGAMANIGVSQSPPHHTHSSRRRQHSNAALDFFPEELFTHPNSDSRKRHNSSSSNDVHMDSPSHKRSRLL